MAAFRVFNVWQALRRFRALDESFRQLVFYSEGSGDWPHIGPVVAELLRTHKRRVSYLTSDASDPGLAVQDENLQSFLIGSGSVRTILFRSIKCRHFVMTLPDLETFHLKRSEHDVNYVYLFHALNSTHTVYRRGAFDAYDTILCVGPHHVDEIRRTEAAYGLEAKQLVEHGSVKLDTVLTQVGLAGSKVSSEGDRRVLIAPSWGDCSLIEQPAGTQLITALVDRGLTTVLRLHPMTVRRLPSLVRDLRNRFRDRPLFAIEENMNAIDSWLQSHVMISDWSSAATEFAFATQKPVIYLETPQKLNNPEWTKIGLPGFEDFIRREIGQVVSLGAMSTVPDLVDDCCASAASMRDRVLAARSKWVYNVGASTETAATYLASLS